MFVVPKARSKKAAKGWQLVGRGQPSEAAPANNGRTVRPLTYTEITEMSAADAEWHVQHNKTNWEAAFDEQTRLRQSKKHVALNRTKLQWEGNSTEDEDRLAQIAGDTFAKKFPQFERSLPNAQKMARYMQENDLPGTELSSYITAFRALAEKGELTLAKPESSAEFLNKHPELRDSRTPPMIAARNAKAEATKAAFANAESNTASAGVINFTDYPERERIGYGNHTRYSFRKLLENLSAEDYRQRLIDDRSFSDAVDRLNNGNG